MVFAILRRATRRAGLATADKDHLHHRLLRIGHGHRQTVLLLWAWTAVLSAFALYPALTGRSTLLVPIGVAAIGLLGYSAAVFWRTRRRSLDDEGADQPIETV